MAQYLQQLKIQNFMRVSALTINADGNHVEISGKNATGKSTALLALFAALNYRNAPEMTMPIKDGQTEASVRVDLGDYVVERSWSAAKGTKLTVFGKDGSKISSPQKLLDSLLADFSLKPAEFLGERPQAQIATLLKACAVEPPEGAVRDIAGDAIEMLDSEGADAYMARLCADTSGLYYQKRRDANAEQKRAESAAKAADDALAAAGGPPDRDGDLPSVSEILVKVDELTMREDERKSAVQGLENAQRQKREAQVAVDDIQDSLFRAKKTLDAWIQAVLDRTQEAEAFDDVSAELAEAKGAVAGAEEARTAHAARKSASYRADVCSDAAANAKDSAKNADSVLERLRDLRNNLLDGVDLGLEGLSVASGTITLNGIPLSQASRAEQMIFTCRVLMLERPDLRLLSLDDCEHLDSDSLKKVLAFADEKGYQVLYTLVSDNEELKVEIVEPAVAPVTD